MAIALPATAANITYDFTVTPDFGPLLGESYAGSFTFNDTNLIGFGEEFITVDSFSFSFLGVDYTEADGAAEEPEATFFDGSFLGLGFSEDDFSFIAGFLDLSEAFFAYDLAAGSGTGDIIYTQVPDQKSVPEPASVLALLAIGAAGATSARRRQSA